MPGTTPGDLSLEIEQGADAGPGVVLVLVHGGGRRGGGDERLDGVVVHAVLPLAGADVGDEGELAREAPLEADADLAVALVGAVHAVHLGAADPGAAEDVR